MKRALDIVGATVGLLLLLPVFLVIALVVVVSSGLPVLFLQLRVGKGGRGFRLVKFRTMTVLKDAEKGAFELGCARRVTAVGRILRKTKLDELPQLWNVLVGDMSLVGPRPEVRIWVDAYPDRWAKVLRVRPGITDPASIEFRDEEAVLAQTADPEWAYREKILPRKLDLYESYVNHHTLWGDIKLVAQTIWELVRQESRNSDQEVGKTETTAGSTWPEAMRCPQKAETRETRRK